MHRTTSVRGILVSFALTLNACAPSPANRPPPPVDLIPFATSTKSPLRTPEALIAAETPLPSPTPFTYTVQSGDTMSGIAEKFGVALEDLVAANPEVSPNAMSVGQALKIPSSPDNPTGEPTPTPAPLTLEQVECYRTADKGVWCFVLVHNDFPELMENVRAQVTLVDSNEAVIASQTALLPLNILPPDAALPLAVFFPPEIPFEARPQVQVLTAIRLSPNDERYLPATINNTLVQVAAEGHYAQITGQVLLPAQSKAASQVWVAAVAYDESGRVVGFRRWEGSGIQPGGGLTINMTVASLGGVVKRVEFAVEARP